MNARSIRRSTERRVPDWEGRPQAKWAAYRSHALAARVPRVPLEVDVYEDESERTVIYESHVRDLARGRRTPPPAALRRPPKVVPGTIRRPSDPVGHAADLVLDEDDFITVTNDVPPSTIPPPPKPPTLPIAPRPAAQPPKPPLAAKPPLLPLAHAVIKKLEPPAPAPAPERSDAPEEPDAAKAGEPPANDEGTENEKNEESAVEPAVLPRSAVPTKNVARRRPVLLLCGRLALRISGWLLFAFVRFCQAAWRVGRVPMPSAFASVTFLLGVVLTLYLIR